MDNSAPETLLSKTDADRIFSLTKPEWNQQAKEYVGSGWIVTSQHDTGAQVAMINPSTGTGLAVHPLFANDHEPPIMVIVSNHFPMGALPPMTDEAKRDIQAAAQKNLGSDYQVKLQHAKLEHSEVIELIVTKRPDA
jgi:hypothetical protein